MKSFEDVVRSMSAREIIMAMVDGLKNPAVKVNMMTFGASEYDQNDKLVCYGCAATNAICHITKVTFTPKTIGSTHWRSKILNTTDVFLEAFENAIDHLRSGGIGDYNDLAAWHGFALIKNIPVDDLPCLFTGTYMNDLGAYEKLANMQEEKIETHTSNK